MNKYGLYVKLKTTKGNGQKLADILIQASAVVSNCKGFHMYLVSLDKKEEDAVIVTEVWDSKEDHDNSIKMDAVRALIGQAMPIIAESPSGGHEMEVLNY